MWEERTLSSRQYCVSSAACVLFATNTRLLVIFLPQNLCTKTAAAAAVILLRTHSAHFCPCLALLVAVYSCGTNQIRIYGYSFIPVVYKTTGSRREAGKGGWWRRTEGRRAGLNKERERGRGRHQEEPTRYHSSVVQSIGEQDDE